MMHFLTMQGWPDWAVALRNVTIGGFAIFLWCGRKIWHKK